MNQNWNTFLNNENVKKEIIKIEKHLNYELYFPEHDKIYRFTDIDSLKIKVIIVGMEPYASSFVENKIEFPEATGRSFEVRSLKSWEQKFKQSSLRNILKAIYKTYYHKSVSMDEIRGKIKTKEFPISEPKVWFDNLEKQGVLFLNASLTVKQHEPNTHTKLWEDFMNLLTDYLNNINPNIIWCLFGKQAQERFQNKVNHSLCACHPRLTEFCNTDIFIQLKDKINFIV